MFRKFLVICIAFLSFSCCFAGNSNPLEWDFGIVKAGEIAKHSFLIKNETEKILKIREVSTSCGCTVSDVKNKTLKPQETTLLEVAFNSKGYSGDVQQFIYVNTDNLDNPVIRYIIKAKVEK
ncbi:MAG: DUF1573 domain-containing protein [Candidatus Omnitrophica bacterium]|nr:DUF1573 domain-containing protein [Candidatus Omnitrophota bacterium]